MSTLKTNNIEHLDASSPSIQLDVGGGMVVAGVITATSMDLSGSDGFTVGTGASVSSPATNVLALGTNNTERVRIFSDGRIGINTTTVSFGRVQLTQESDTDEGGIGIVDSTISRSMRLYCTAASAVINSGNGGSGNLVLNEGSGNVGIGTDNPYANSGTNLHIHSANTTSEIRLTNSTTGGGLNGSIVQQGGNTLYISNSESGNTVFENAGSERARVTSGGNLQIANGNLVFSTSGTGIDFSATADSGSSGTTNVSELLDDYEEGDWIPTMFGGTTAGTTTYTHQTGNYTKIGNRVIVSGTVAATTSGASGDLRIGNFPFTAGDESVGTFQVNELSSWQSGVEQYSLIIQSGNSFCTFRGTKQAAAFVTMQIQDVTYLRFNVSYTV